MITNKTPVRCPHCGKRTALTLLPGARAVNLILYCNGCHRELKVNISPEPEP